MNEQNTTRKKKGKQSITKRKRESADRQTLYGAFDFETSGLDGDVVFGTLQRELMPTGERSPTYRTYSAGGMLDLLIEHNAPRLRWFAHNLEYDLLFLLREANYRLQCGELKKVELFERGMNTFYKAVFHLNDGSRLELYDSMALFGFSLRVFLANFSSVGDKLHIDFDSEQFNVGNDSHLEYAIRDTEGLLDAMVNFDAAIYSIFGVHCKGTISATALAAWEVTLDEDDRFNKLSEPQAEFCRDAYFGGIVFLTDTGPKKDYVSLDVNSMYPYVMRRYGVPEGVPSYTRRFVPGKPGIYKADFIAPDDLAFGCVGYRDAKGICWPRGQFTSTVFDFELERARRWGYQIKVREGLVFDDVCYPFQKIVDLCEEKRREYKKQPFEIVVKLIQNSIYGKFGTKTEGKEVLIIVDEDLLDLDEGWLPYVNEMVGAAGIESVYERETERDAYYMLPHWAAHITARARAELLDGFEAAAAARRINDGECYHWGDWQATGGAIYGDTDSIKVPRETYETLKMTAQIRTGAAYGDFKLDDEYQDFRAIAPKVYSYSHGGEFGGKGKGIPEKQRTPAFWADVFQGDRPTVEYNSLGKLHSALKKGGARELTPQTRTSTDLNNSAAWFDGGEGKIKSVKIIDGRRNKC